MLVTDCVRCSGDRDFSSHKVAVPKYIYCDEHPWKSEASVKIYDCIILS